jgi:His-Xaa-Ser system radical SAM maturase HxsB
MEGAEAFDMSQDTAIRSLKLMFMSPSQSLKIEFQGGEPLLNFDLIKFIVKTAKEMNLTEDRHLQFVITSNLTFVNDELIEFCDKNDIYISTSLDGPEDIHNKNRPRPNKDGYIKTIQGIKKIQNSLGFNKVSALMTTTVDSLERPREIIDEYVNQNLHSIFLRPLSPYGFAIKTKQTEKYNIDNWMEFYREGLRYIIDLNKAGYFMVEQYTAIILKKIFDPANPGYVDLQSPAGIGISAVVYNYDGDVYASDEARMLKEMGDEKFKLGNVLTNNYNEIFGSDILLDTLEESLSESAPMCSDCGLVTYCGADPVYHYATQGDVVGKKPLSFF